MQVLVWANDGKKDDPRSEFATLQLSLFRYLVAGLASLKHSFWFCSSNLSLGFEENL